MANRLLIPAGSRPAGKPLLTGRRLAFIVGCVFCCAVAIAGQAQAATMSVDIIAQGSRIFASSDWQIAGSNADLGGLPANLTCGQEVLTAGYTFSTLSQDGTYQTSQAVDDSEIMKFNAETSLAAGKTILSEHTGIFSLDAGATVGNCESVVNSTTYNEAASAETWFMGDALNLQSSSAISQADSVIPDSLRVKTLATGSGRIQFNIDVKSQIGIGNSSAIGLENEMHQRVITGGKPFNAGMVFNFTSFAPLPETAPAVGIEGALPEAGG